MGKPTADIQSPRLMYIKAILFVCSGLLASGLLINENPSLKTAALLVVAAWTFARAYYFAFYVIEHYIDPGFRYQGLMAFVRYLIEQRKLRKGAHDQFREGV